MTRMKVRTFRWEATQEEYLRRRYGTVSGGIRRLLEAAMTVEQVLDERLRGWTEALAFLLERPVEHPVIPVRMDAPARVWDGRAWVSAIGLLGWAADRASQEAGRYVLPAQHDLAAVWGLHVGRTLGLDETRALALGTFCHEWLGAWCDVSGAARDAADACVRVMAAVLTGRLDEPWRLSLPPERRLFPMAEHEVPAYRRGWKAVVGFLRLHQAGRIRPGPWGQTRTWLLDGAPAVPRLVLEAEGIPTEPAAADGRSWPAEAGLFWYMPEGFRWNLEDPAVRRHVVFQVMTRGNDVDIVRLMRALTPQELREAYLAVRERLPERVRRFWDDLLARFLPLPHDRGR